MAKVFKTLKKKAQATSLVGVILDSLKSENPRQNAPSIQAVLDNLQPKQLLINPDFQVWQRGEELTSTINTKNYLCDMWYILDSASITVKKVDNGIKIVNYNLQDARLSQNIEIEVGKKYTLVTSINGEVHSLEIIGGTYTENSFMGYSLHGDKERIYVVGNTNDVINYCDLFEGDIAYPHVREDEAIALMRCQHKIIVITNITGMVNGSGNNLYTAIQQNLDSNPSAIVNGGAVYIDGFFNSNVTQVIYQNWVKNGSIELVIKFGNTTDNGKAGRFIDGKIILSCEPL